MLKLKRKGRTRRELSPRTSGPRPRPGRGDGARGAGRGSGVLAAVVCVLTWLVGTWVFAF